MSTMARSTARPTSLFLTLCAALPMLAHADDSAVVASMTATLSNVSIQLINLDPNDGIAPSLTFNSVAMLSGSGLPIYSNGLLPVSTTTNTLDNGATTVTTSPTSIEVKSQLTYGDLKKNGTSYESNAYSTLSANITNRTTSLNLSDPSNLSLAGYTLSPHTIAVVRGTISNSWSLDGQAIASALDPKYTSWSLSSYGGGPYVALTLSSYNQFVDASGAVGGTNLTATANELLTTNQSISSYWDAAANGTFPLKSNQSSNDFVLNIANVTDQNQTGTAYLDVSVDTNIFFNASTPIDPGTPSIPEPGTYALMGLGLVGLTLVRRQRR